MVDHRMNVSITNNAQFPLAEIALDASESVRIQTGSMIYHTPNVVLNAKVNAESQSIFGKESKLWAVLWLLAKECLSLKQLLNQITVV